MPVTVISKGKVDGFRHRLRLKPVPGTKEFLQVTQNERKYKIFFLLYPKFGHNLVIISKKRYEKGVSNDTP